ncbi:hypothetical protein MM221_07515 [Salipaludibacillus sp. LMS25]|jgi:flagellar assembly factor FliW|uniref:hypothetical protein n=1 Tax=Salipaludibacillus sp. LMS25 TaxID=2924031 RepID=UPI0020D1CD04|nr:hypothetical protein [Salipaludibacillus sp. LMS25]UTR16385.1 hypothetical protein MM221_07515 [Salipaludibacillus sp. LMS25]
MSKTLFLPYINSNDYLSNIPDNTILFSRFENDFQKDCLLFTESKKNCIYLDELEILINKGLKFCYVYDMFHFENREFTIEGYKTIRNDIDKIIKSGFSYILVSNPFIIEIICNEYRGKINLVISSQLEINNERGKLFFEVLNDSSPITHLIVSQNHLTKSRLKKIINTFPNLEIILEIDRFSSDNQIVHEYYYNILYGYYNDFAIDILNEFIINNKKYIKSPEQIFYNYTNLGYKIGELNADPGIVLKNVSNFETMEIRNIDIIDLQLW